MDVRFLPRPSKAQYDWQDLELGLFIHWIPMGWYDVVDEKRLSDPDYQREVMARVTCTELDTDQWVQSAVDLGAKYIMFVAKHGLGFCLWQTDAGSFNMKNVPYKDGKGDPFAMLSQSCKKFGVKLGVYLAGTSMCYKIADSGRASSDDAQKEYNAIYRQWLIEVLSRYGEMMEVWFDGSLSIEVGDILKKYAPNAMVFQSKYATIRWVGQEEGYAADPAWNGISRYDAISGVAIQQHGTPDGDAWMPMECDARLRQCWGWQDDLSENRLRSLDELMNMYYASVGHGATLLINQAPNLQGRIIDEDMARMKEFGDEIRRRFGNPIAKTTGEGAEVVLDLGGMKRVDHVILMEETIEGERVREYKLEGFDGKDWIRLATGTAIGHKKIDFFGGVKIDKVRFTATESVGTPIIRSMAAFDVGTTPKRVDRPERGIFKVGEFGTEMYDIKKKEAFFSYPINPYIDDAGQYRITFNHTRQDSTLFIERAWVEVDGIEMPEYLTKVDELVYDIYVGGVGSRITFHMHATEKKWPMLHGDVLIQRLV